MLAELLHMTLPEADKSNGMLRKRSYLFPGSMCFPLSPGKDKTVLAHKSHMPVSFQEGTNENDQLALILKMLGKLDKD